MRDTSDELLRELVEVVLIAEGSLKLSNLEVPRYAFETVAQESSGTDPNAVADHPAD